MNEEHTTELVMIPQRRLRHDPDNPNGRTRDTQDLQRSIAAAGLHTPLEVYADEDSENFFVRNGNRRLAALRALARDGMNVDPIPCFVTERAESANDNRIGAAAANVQRELTPSERGEILLEVMEDRFWPLNRAAAAIGIKPEKAELYIQIAQADEVVRRKVDSGEMSISAFQRIVRTPRDVQREIAGQEGRVTVRQATRQARQAQQEGAEPIPGAVADEPNLVAELNKFADFLERVLSNPLGPREEYVIENRIKPLLSD